MNLRLKEKKPYSLVRAREELRSQLVPLLTHRRGTGAQEDQGLGLSLHRWAPAQPIRPPGLLTGNGASSSR